MQRTEGQFRGVRDVSIYWQAWLPERTAKIAAQVALIHGLGEHSGRYTQLAAELVAEGCAVYALDHRGHGRSGGPRALIDRFDHAVTDIEQLMGLMRQQCGTRAVPQFMLGHSMGGALSLHYASRHAGELQGLMLSGPAVALDGMPPLFKPISRALSAILPRLGTFPIDPAMVSRDPKAAADYGSDPLNCHGKVPVRTLSEIIGAVEAMPQALRHLAMPLLIQHGSDDKLAGVAGSERVIEQVASTDKTLKVYPGLYHEIFNEIPRDRQRVFADLRAWLKPRLSP